MRVLAPILTVTTIISTLHQRPCSAYQLSPRPSRISTISFPKNNNLRMVSTSTPLPPSPTSSKKKSSVSPAARWHATRRREMIKRHPKEIRALESQRSLSVTLPLLIVANLTLFTLSILCGSLPLYQVFLLAATVGSVMSLWQLQILHEALHGSMLGAGTQLHRNWVEKVLFWGSIPSAFGYWLYLSNGHLSHHRSVGKFSLNEAFEGSSMDLADGDVLFVNHRMDMVGDAGPRINLPRQKDPLILSIGRFGFGFWKRGDAFRNALLFSTTFLVERVMLISNDAVVALCGRNFFFPNKPKEFHDKCAAYARVAVCVRLGLCWLSSCLFAPGAVTVAAVWTWKPLLFLMLSETLWSLPPHPACAMFITNHGSNTDNGECEPTGSTYAGKWYSALTLGTNYHVEHHDFPTVPLNKLGELRKIVGKDFYRMNQDDDLGEIMENAFAYPDFYACSNVNSVLDE